MNLEIRQAAEHNADRRIDPAVQRTELEIAVFVALILSN